MKKLHLINQLKQLKKRLAHYFKGVKRIMKKCAIDLIFSIEELELKIECLSRKGDKKQLRRYLVDALDYFAKIAYYDHLKFDKDKFEHLLKTVLIFLGKRSKDALQTYLLETFGYKSIKFLDNGDSWLLCRYLICKLRGAC